MFLHYVLLIVWGFLHFGHAMVTVKRLELCDPKIDYPNKVYAKFRTVNGQQYVNANITIRVAVDNTVHINATVDMLMNGQKPEHVVTVIEKKACTSIHKYMSEFAYDIERRLQLIPGMCPIPEGRYHLHNYPLEDYYRIAIPPLPLGNLRITVVATNRTSYVLYCLEMELQNQP